MVVRKRHFADEENDPGQSDIHYCATESEGCLTPIENCANRTHPGHDRPDGDVSPSNTNAEHTEALYHEKMSDYESEAGGSHDLYKYTSATDVPTRKAAVTATGWTSLLKEVGATAGGMTLAVSFESRKSLKYCITWLQYAIAHKEHRIAMLRALIDEMRQDKHRFVTPVVQQLMQIQADITNIIRSVITVASRYASDALPEYAFKLVRHFFLSLPERWTTRYHALEITVPQTPRSLPTPPRHVDADAGMHAAEHANSKMKVDADAEMRSVHSRSGSVSMANGEAHNEDVFDENNSNLRYERAATKILTLAVESLDIVSNVAQVFRDVVNRADSWADRFHLTRPADANLEDMTMPGEAGEGPSKLPTFSELPKDSLHKSMHVDDDAEEQRIHPSKRSRHDTNTTSTVHHSHV